MPAGRPTDLTPELIEEYCKLLPVVQYIETASDILGVDRSTWQKWARRGARELKRLAKTKGGKVKPKEAIYVEFVRAHKKAIAEGQQSDLQAIRDAAAKGNWQAAAWRLERRCPELWGANRDELRKIGKAVADQMKHAESNHHAQPKAPASTTISRDRVK